MQTLGECLDKGQRNRFDELRLAAALLVIVSHCWPLFGRSDEPFKVLTGHVGGGEIAVAVFFTVSGFLIYRSAERSTSWVRFVRARLLRIIPGAAVCALFCMLVVGLTMTTWRWVDYLSHVRTWLFLKNAVPFAVAYKLPGVFEGNLYPTVVNGALWTLPIELRLYVICGLAFFLVPKGALQRFLPPALALVGLAMSGLVLPHYNVFKGEAFWLAHFGYFYFCGAAFYVWRDQLPINTWAIIGLAGLTLLSLKTAAFPWVFAMSLPYAVMWGAFAGLNQTSAAGRAQLPDLSYGLYIYGFPVQQVVSHEFGRTQPFAVCMMLSIAGASVLAALSWHFVEKPCLRLKDRGDDQTAATVPARL
jgi:peptidoglycan/LPS O-acetylase OafA/YrhL